MLALATFVKELHRYFPNGYVSIIPSVMVHEDGRYDFGYYLNIQELNICKEFPTFKELKRYAHAAIVARIGPPYEKPLMYSEFEKNSFDN